jgi:hypothetical protein
MRANGGQDGAAPRDSRSTAPVAVGHPRRRPGWGLVVLVLLLVLTVVALLPRSAPTPDTTPAPVTPAPPASPSVPFAVAVDVREVTPLDNDGLFGREVTPPDDAVDTAALQVEDVLQTYLNAAFVTSGTRFTGQPLADLLSPTALDEATDQDLAGLGALDLTVQRVKAEPVIASTRVLTRGDDVAMVEVRYEARAQVTAGGGEPLVMHQRASMVFVPEDGTWRAEAVDAELGFPPWVEVTR